MRREHGQLRDHLRSRFDHRPFTTAEASAAGVSKDRLERAVRSGALVRIRRGVYALTYDMRADLQDRIDRLGVVGISATVARRTAGPIWGVPEYGVSGTLAPAPATLVVPAETNVRRGSRSGMRLVAMDLHPNEITLLSGLPITTPLRTAVDIARELGRDRPSALVPLCGGIRVEGIRRAFPHWVPEAIRGPMSATDATSYSTSSPTSHEITNALRGHKLRDHLHRDLLDIVSRTGRYGTTWIRQVLDDVEPLLESPAETLAWSHLTVADLPRPIPQAVVYGLSGRAYRADFLIAGRVIVEVDGAIKYTDTTPWHEKQRQSDLEAAGYWVVRCTWEELIRHPERVLARVHHALARAAA